MNNRNNMNNIKYIIEGNWDDVKGKVQSYWGKLTDDHLEEINGSFKELTGQLKKLYGYKASEVENEIIEFFNSSDFEKLKKKAREKVEEIKSIVVSTLDEYVQSAKQKSIDTEQAIVEYISANPLKSVGIVAVTGMLISYVLSNCRRD